MLIHINKRVSQSSTIGPLKLNKTWNKFVWDNVQRYSMHKSHVFMLYDLQKGGRYNHVRLN